MININKSLVNEMMNAIIGKYDSNIYSGSLYPEHYIREKLEKYWEDKMANIWCADDVISNAEDCGLGKITREEAIKILEIAYHNIDCDTGITWDSLEFETARYLSSYKDCNQLH